MIAYTEHKGIDQLNKTMVGQINGVIASGWYIQLSAAVSAFECGVGSQNEQRAEREKGSQWGRPEKESRRRKGRRVGISQK